MATPLNFDILGQATPEEMQKFRSGLLSYSELAAIVSERAKATPQPAPAPVEQLQQERGLVDRILDLPKAAAAGLGLARQEWSDKFDRSDFANLDYYLTLDEQGKSDLLNRAGELEQRGASDPRTGLPFRAEAADLRRRVELSNQIQADPNAATKLADLAERLKLGAKEKERLSSILDKTDTLRINRAISSVAGQPEQLVSAVGMGLGFVPGAQLPAAGVTVAGAGVTAKVAYDAAYTEARLNNDLSPEEADAFAKWMTTSEFAGELVGLGGGPAKGLIKSAFKEWLKRTAKVGAVEGLSEAATGTLQDVGNVAISNLGGDRIAKYAQSQLPTSAGEFATRRYDEFLAGALGGGLVQGAGGIPQVREDVRVQKIKELRDTFISTQERLRRAAELSGATPDTIVAAEAGVQAALAIQAQEPVQGVLDLQGGESTTPSTISRPEPSQEVTEAQRQLALEDANRRAQVTVDALRNTAADNVAQAEQAQGRINEALQMDLPVNQQDTLAVQQSTQIAEEANKAADRLAVAEGAREQQLPLEQPEQPKAKPFEEFKSRSGEVFVRDTETGEVVARNDQKILEAKQRNRLQAANEFDKLNKKWSKARAAKETQLINLAAETGKDSAWVRGQLDKWDQNNPKPSLEQITQQRQAKAQEQLAKLETPAPTQVSKPAKTKPQKATVSKQDLAAKYGVSLESVTEDTAEVEPDVVNKIDRLSNNIVRSLGIKNTDALINGLKNNNVVVVKSVDQLPVKANPKAQGIYSDGKVYLVLDNINDKSDVPTLLHEVVHKARDGAKVKFSKSVAQMIGPENGAKIVAKLEKIRGTNKLADAALRRAEAARDRAPESQKQRVYMEEAFGYAITEAEKARKNRTGLGSMTGAVSDIINSAKLFISDLLGTEVNVTPEILAEMNRKSFADVVGAKVQEEQRPALETVIGPNSSKFVEEAITRPEDVYTGPEGNRRIEVADRKANINPASITFLNRVGQVKLGRFITNIQEVYGYDTEVVQPVEADMGNGITDTIELSLKPLKDVDIRIDPNTTNQAYYDPFNDTIFVNKSVLASPEEARPWIFHEMQHAIQFRESNLNGADFTKFLNEEADKAGLDVKIVERPGKKPKPVFTAREGVKATKAIARAAFDKAWKRYDRNYGEAEARLAETNYLMTEEEMRQQLPEERMTTREGKRIPREELILESVAAEEDAETSSEEAVRLAKTLLNPTGNLGTELFEIRDFARNITAARSGKAEILQKQFKAGIKKAAAAANVTEQEFLDTLAKEIDKIDAIEDADKRSNAMDILEAKYPGVGASLRQLREFKLNMSKEIIKLILKGAPDKLSEKDAKLIDKIYVNAERYNTRAYLATLGGKDQAKAYGRQFLKRAKINPESAEGKKLKAAVDWLVENDLLIPDTREALEEKSKGELKRMYNAWIGDAPTGKKAKKKMIDALEKHGSVNRDIMESKALEIIKEMLGQTKDMGPLASYYRGGKINRTILQSKTNIPKELRDVLGEITDPYLREAITLARMSQLIGHLTLPTEIASVGQGTYVSDTKTDKFQYQLKGPAYGALDGKFVTREVYDAMTDVTNFYAQFDEALANAAHDATALAKYAAGKALPVFSRITGLQKKADIVGNIAYYFINLIGAAGIMAPMNGISPVGRNAVKGLINTMKTVVATTGRDVRDMDVVVELLEAGVLDSATVGEFSSQVYRDIFNQVDKLNSEDALFMAKLGKIVWEAVSKGKRFDNSKPGEFMTELYAAMDVWVKAATYYDRKNFYQKYNEAEGIQMTETQLRRRAGFEASATNVSYKLAIPLVRMLERNVPGTMYLTYFAETYRATMMSFVQAYRDYGLAADAKTAEGKRLATGIATRRMLGTLAMTAGWTAAVNMFLDSEDDEEKKKRDLRAEYLSNSLLIPVGTNPDGHTVSLPVERVHPVGNPTEMLTAVIQAEDKPEAAMDYLSGLFVRNKQFGNFLQIITDVAAEMGAGKDKRAKDTMLEAKYPEAYDAIKQYLSFGDLGENLVTFLEGYVPASARPALEEKPRVAKYNEDIVSQALAQPLVEMGWKPVTEDPDKDLEFRSRDYNNAVGELRNEWNDFLSTPRARDPEASYEKMQELMEQERKAFDELRAAYEGYTAYEGYDFRRAIATMTRPNVRIPKDVATAVRYGRFRSNVISADKVNDWYKNQVKALDRRDPNFKQERELLDLQRRALMEAVKRN